MAVQKSSQMWPEKKLSDIKPGDSYCLNCKFFDKYPEQKRADNLIGACKANPPSPAPDWGDNKLGVWPAVLANFWCGIFEEKK